MQVNLHTCVQTYGYTHWGERAAAGTASSPLRVLRASKPDGSPGLLRWRCCHGGGFPLQYVRACLMTHSFLTLGFISYEDVYITNGVYIFIRKILWSCTIVFLRMSVSFTMYLVRDDLINKWNQISIGNFFRPGALKYSLYNIEPESKCLRVKFFVPLRMPIITKYLLMMACLLTTPWTWRMKWCLVAFPDKPGA